MIITNSNDITLLDVQVTFDISGTTPVITIVNLSQGPNLQNIAYAFVVNSPSQTPIHQGSLSNPDITGIWQSTVLTDPWPRPFGQIEWSGAPYTFAVFAQDSAGNQYQVDKIATIRRPPGNTNLSKDTFGVADVELLVECEQAGIFLQDTTNASYMGLSGTQVSSVMRIIYPIDQTDSIPAPFIANNFSQAIVPITYSSTNYQFAFNTVYDYDQQNNVIVRIKYRLVSRFSVLCNIDLCPLACEFHSLVESLENGTCVDANATQQKIIKITPLFNLVMIGIKEPLCGIDVPSLIKRIETIGGFSCDCCNTATGVIPQTSSIIDNYTFQIVPVCGDIRGTVTTNGNLIQFNLQDVSYIFQMGPSTDPTNAAFSVTPTTNGTNCTKTYTLAVNPELLAQGMLQTIGGNAYLLNILNSYITANGGNALIAVNGGCVFASQVSTDYIFTMTGIPASGSLAILKSITVNGTPTTISYSFNLTNLGGLQTYLNTLGLGTFTVGNSGSTVTVTSNDNPNNLSVLLYQVGVTTSQAAMTSTPAGFVPITTEYAIQKLINYVCGLTDEQMTTSEVLTIQGVPLPVGTTQAVVNQAIENALDALFNDIENFTGVNCAALKAIFLPSATVPLATDTLYGVVNGVCSSVTLLGLLQAMIAVGSKDPTTTASFCAWVSQCAQGQTCAPYTFFQVIVSPHNTTCTAIVGIEGAFS